jgi:hypothetical protein
MSARRWIELSELDGSEMRLGRQISRLNATRLPSRPEIAIHLGFS